MLPLKERKEKDPFITHVSGLMLSLFCFKADWVEKEKDSCPCWALAISWVWGIQSLNASWGEWWGSRLCHAGRRAWGVCASDRLHQSLGKLSWAYVSTICSSISKCLWLKYHHLAFWVEFPLLFCLPVPWAKTQLSCATRSYVFPLSWGILSVEGLRKTLLHFFYMWC